jgi:hypothetical protein
VGHVHDTERLAKVRLNRHPPLHMRQFEVHLTCNGQLLWLSVVLPSKTCAIECRGREKALCEPPSVVRVTRQADDNAFVCATGGCAREEFGRRKQVGSVSK